MSFEDDQLFKRVRRGMVQYLRDGTGKIVGIKSIDGTFQITTNGVALPGPQGIPGKDGLDGAPGHDGVDGKQGLPGKDGVSGKDGLNGAQGLPGAPGADGANGKDATPGSPGKDGLNGTDGAAGRNGTNGVDGLPGRDGAAGKDGSQGQQGIRGYTGADGLAGKDGAQGFQGIQGVPGKDGAQGSAGKDGAPGKDGATGTMPTAVFSVSARGLNTAFLISATRDAQVVYGVDIAITALLANTQGTAFLEYADNAAMSTNVVIVASTSSMLGGVLNVANTMTATLAGRIPAGKYARIRTAIGSGTPTFAIRQGQEVLI